MMLAARLIWLWVFLSPATTTALLLWVLL